VERGEERRKGDKMERKGEIWEVRGTNEKNGRRCGKGS